VFHKQNLLELLLAVGALPLVSGCSLIVGLDGYSFTSEQDAGLTIDGAASDAASDASRDGGLDAGVEMTGPSVVWTDPSAGAADAEPSETIRAEFDVDIDPTTIDDESFRVSHSGEEVSGVVSYDASTRVATFTPDDDLALLREHIVVIASSVADLDGNSLEDDHQWGFRVRDGAWTAPEMLGVNPTAPPEIAVTPKRRWPPGPSPADRARS